MPDFRFTSSFLLGLLALAFAIAVGGCDGDGTSDDDGGTDTPDGGGMDICTAASDGTPCGSSMVCVGGSCVAEGCGDGIISDGEDCEDGNDIAFDGCEPVTCTFTCTADAACSNSNPCDGEETCDADMHLCATSDPPADGADCTREGGEMGACRLGECVARGCGNGVMDPGEECDDGNTTDGDGCETTCEFSCEMDEDCTDRDVCTGMESCDLVSHTCQPGDPLVCDDGNECTENLCDAAMGCQHPLIDMDGDGHAPDTFACGDDCDDTEPTVFTGAEELCDGIDNNCNVDVDETAPTWYVDCDSDGYAAAGAASRVGCTEPAGSATGCDGSWTTLAPAGSNIDCHDGRADVSPGQNNYFENPYAIGGGLSYDYNCNGVDDTELRCLTVDRTSCCSTGSGNCFSSGWRHPPSTETDHPAWGCRSIWSPDPPDCGERADYLECGRSAPGMCAAAGSGCTTTMRNRRQACR